MTYTSLTVKLLVSIALATSILTLFPQTVISSVSTQVETPIVVIPVATPSVVIKKGPIVRLLIKGDCTKYESIIDKYDWPINIAMQICKDESSGDPANINWNDPHYDAKGNLICSTSRGLFQVACFWPTSLGYTLADLILPEKNIAMAYHIYSQFGFSPWTTYKKNLGIVKQDLK